MNTFKDKITALHWCFKSNLIPRKKWLKKLFWNFICMVINHDFFVIILWITHSLSLSLEELKLIAVVNWILHVSGFLKSFLMSFKYGLILSRYSSFDCVLFISLYFHIQHNCYSKNRLLSLVCNNLLLHSQKDSQYLLLLYL